jgi:hypothetical protein
MVIFIEECLLTPQTVPSLMINVMMLLLALSVTLNVVVARLYPSISQVSTIFFHFLLSSRGRHP